MKETTRVGTRVTDSLFSSSHLRLTPLCVYSDSKPVCVNREVHMANSNKKKNCILRIFSKVIDKIGEISRFRRYKFMWCKNTSTFLKIRTKKFFFFKSLTHKVRKFSLEYVVCNKSINKCKLTHTIKANRFMRDFDPHRLLRFTS